MTPEGSAAQGRDTIVRWNGPGPGWYGLLRASFDDADRFGKFTDADYEVMAQVAAECIERITVTRCDAKYNRRPGEDALQCLLPRGHFGEHEAVTSDAG